MVLLRPGFERDYEGRPPVYAIGCAGTIEEVEQLPDGRYVIELRGFTKFRVTSEDQSRQYRLGRVEAVPEASDAGDAVDLGALRLRLERALASTIPADSELHSLPDAEFVNALAQGLPMEPGDRQELLELAGPVSRARALIVRVEPPLRVSR
jgi:Lon protease-like protein